MIWEVPIYSRQLIQMILQKRHSYTYACFGKHCVYYCMEPLTQVELYTMPSISQEALQEKPWGRKILMESLCKQGILF